MGVDRGVLNEIQTHDPQLQRSRSTKIIASILGLRRIPMFAWLIFQI